MKEFMFKFRKFFKKTNSKRERSKWRSLYDPHEGKWYFADERNHLWICDDETQSVCLDITLNDFLLMEGEVRELTHKLMMLRRMMNLREGDPLPEFELIESNAAPKPSKE